ncbi:hypothetical protein [Cellulomonas sp. URHD0024]|uniref:hypothetical protein n=1 Tax=Cellulomonas sp. URHD0024 TaxID=1302620 RepID=UPI0004129648|nr:hypothetical protein [Cellulomonas sp. URHD0024]
MSADTALAPAEALARSAERTRFATAAERVADEALDARSAAEFLGVDDASVEALLRSGLVPTGPRGIAYHDVAALGLNSGLGTSVSERGIAMMMRFARGGVEPLLGPVDWAFTVTLDPSASDGAVEVREPSEGGVLLSVAPGRRTVTGRLRTFGRWSPFVAAELDRSFDRWVADVAPDGPLQFQWVSDVGREDPVARLAEGRVDCVCLALVAADRLARLGFATRLQRGRVLGLLDAQHVWLSVLDEDGEWKRFDPMLAVHSRRLWGRDTDRADAFRGHVVNAMPGWAGTGTAVRVGGHDVLHTFTARKESR